MKKIISTFLALTILILSFSFSVFAQEPVMLSIQDEKVYAGDEFTINVFISDNSKVSGAVVDINYDKDKLEFISAQEGAILDASANISIRNINKDNSYVRFTYMSASSSILSEGIIFRITFKVLDSASGNTNLDITIPNTADFVDNNLEPIAYTVDNGDITILDNVSIDSSAETTTDEIPSNPETTDDVNDETTTNDVVENQNSNDNNNDILVMVVLILVGISLICFGIVFAIKKKNS